MSSKWQTLPLEDCLDALIDYRGKTPEKTASGIPLVTAKIIKGGRIEPPSEFIAEDAYESWMRRGIPRAGDVVLTTEAPMGEVAQLGHERVALAQRVVTLRGKAGLLDSTFLRYLLQTEELQDQLRARATGTTVLGIKQSELRKVTLSLPPIELQRSSAAVLAAIDARIDALRECNATLEAIAQALFKSWFVDFDPVRAKQQGLAPVGMDEATAALFPASFEASTLALLPRAWCAGTVEDLLQLAYGRALKATDRTAGEVPVYGSGGITGVHNEALVDTPTIIVGRKGTVGSLYWEDRPCFPIDTVFYVRPKVPLTFCFYQLGILGLKDMNTDGAVPGLNRGNVYRLPIAIPPPKVLVAFDKSANALRARIFANVQHAQTLATLRDTLLPRLISGKLRLPQNEPELETI